MRKLLIGLTGLALVWCIWWALGAVAIDRALAEWRAARTADGWQISWEGPDVSGFPTAWTSQVANVAIVAPLQAAQATADVTQVRLAAGWPFAAEIRLPETPIRLQTAQQQYSAQLQNTRLTLALAPSFAPTLKSFSARGGASQLNTPQGNLDFAEGFDLALAQNPSDPTRFMLKGIIQAATPGDVFRRQIGLPPDWPRAFETVRLDAEVALNPEAIAMTGRSAKLRALDVHSLELRWGPVSMMVRGNVTVSALGTPDGSLSVLIANWRPLYDGLKSSGAIPPQDQFRSDIMLNALANIGGDPERLDLTLRFENGQMSLGNIPLGPAPEFVF